MSEYLPHIIGQQTIKNRLRVYKESYSKNGRLPMIFLEGPRGNGKTKILREFRKTLVRPDGTTPPLMEVNSASIKKPDQFFEQIFPKASNEKALVFFDEAHKLPDKLKQIFLTVCEKDPNPVRRITYETKDVGVMDYVFDFTEISFVFATTDGQQLPGPLLDRFTQISIGQYSNDDLYKIFKLNLKVDIDDSIKEEVISVFRGHPRASVELAEELDHYADASHISRVEVDDWFSFREIMGVHPYGLNDSELAILKVLGERGVCSVNAICATTGFSRSVVMNKHEHSLMKKGLVDVGQQSKRHLTREGREIYEDIFKQEMSPAPSFKEKKPDPVQTVKDTVNKINSGEHPLYRR